MNIPNFDPIRAERFVMSFADSTVLEFVKLLHLRDIEDVSISDSTFQRQQKKMHNTLNNVMARQLETGIAPIGKKITEMMVEIYRIVNGKAAELWYVSDELDFLKQLGIIKYTEKAKKPFPEDVS